MAKGRPRISFAGFRDPVRRPRFLVWTGVIVLVFAAVMIPVLGATSTRWFCSEGCHKVQDDTIMAYQHSSHSNISCMACHMPVAANPVIFLIHKAEALGELAQTVTNNYELPLNGESEVALTMKSTQCTQCHNMNTRKVTPSVGIKIKHSVHTDKKIDCAICHNRIAHNEDFDLTLKNPKDGEPNKKHHNFMTMTACFRCHGLEEGAPAPGACSACHTPGFDLKPPSHKEADFFPKKHAELAKEAYTEVANTLKETNQTAVTGERKAEFEAASRQSGGKSKETVGETLPPLGAIFYCGTCHKQEFCDACHGTPMPHSSEFKEPKDIKDPKGHPAISKQIPDKCVMCHTKANPNFCNECHHGEKVGYKFDPAIPWVNQHPKAIVKSGIKACTTCHATTFCVECHTKNRVVPSSHRQPGWVKPPVPTMTVYGSQPATPSALHSLAAKESTESCGVCHGEGGVNAPFCAGCHKLTMPHPADFKQFHADTGRKNPAVCKNCHIWPELCSNCHHTGSSTSVAWIKVHGQAVTKNGAQTCVAKCHKQTDCQACHQRNKVLPASHRAGNFLKVEGQPLGQHAQLYKANNSVCTYCHTGDAATLPNSQFCKSCHKVDIPHPQGFGLKDANAAATKANAGLHAQQLQAGQISTAACSNCHGSAFCNNCHHKGSVPNQPWLRYHPTIVKAQGADGCFECHKETFCSNCHTAADPKKLPHEDKLPKVDCSTCHPDPASQHAESVFQSENAGQHSGMRTYRKICQPLAPSSAAACWVSRSTAAKPNAADLI